MLHHSTWETRYVLLLWLSILVLVPFDLRTVDSSLSDLAPAAADDADDGEQRSTLVESIISTCKEYLADPGAVRDAAAVCLSRLLTRYVPWPGHPAPVCWHSLGRRCDCVRTRPDMDSSYLRRFMAWARDQLRFDDDASVFLVRVWEPSVAQHAAACRPASRPMLTTLHADASCACPG